MSRKVTRPCRNIVCTKCGRKTTTTYSADHGDLCPTCRYVAFRCDHPDRIWGPGPDGQPKIIVGEIRKHDLDDLLGGVA